MADELLWLGTAQWQALGTIVLVGVTIWYAIHTARLSKHAKSSAESAVTAAEAAEKSASLAEASVKTAQDAANISEQALMVASTPVVVWSTMTGKVNDAGNPELDFRLINSGPVRPWTLR